MLYVTGVGGGEGAFIMVTFWLVEAMARVGLNLKTITGGFANFEVLDHRLPNTMCLFQISGSWLFRTLTTFCPTQITWACSLKKLPFRVSKWVTAHRLSVTWPVLVLQSI